MFGFKNVHPIVLFITACLLTAMPVACAGSDAKPGRVSTGTTDHSTIPKPIWLSQYKSYRAEYSATYSPGYPVVERVFGPDFISWDVCAPQRKTTISEFIDMVVDPTKVAVKPTLRNTTWTVKDVNNTILFTSPPAPPATNLISSVIVGVNNGFPFNDMFVPAQKVDQLIIKVTSANSKAEFDMSICPRICSHNATTHVPNPITGLNLMRNGKVVKGSQTNLGFNNLDTWDGFFYRAAMKWTPSLPLSRSATGGPSTTASPVLGSAMTFNTSLAAVLKAMSYLESSFDPGNKNGLLNIDTANKGGPTDYLWYVDSEGTTVKRFSPEGGINVGVWHFWSDYTDSDYEFQHANTVPTEVARLKGAVLVFNKGEGTLSSALALVNHYKTLNPKWNLDPAHFDDIIPYLVEAIAAQRDTTVNKFPKFQAFVGSCYVADTFGGPHFTNIGNKRKKFDLQLKEYPFKPGVKRVLNATVSLASGNAWCFGFGEKEGILPSK